MAEWRSKRTEDQAMDNCMANYRDAPKVEHLGDWTIFSQTVGWVAFWAVIIIVVCLL
jgi:hypothetical protein